MENKIKHMENENKHEHTVKHDEKVHEHKHENSEHKPEVKIEKKNAVTKIKKDFAIARGFGLHISKRHGMYICAFIKGKTIDSAIADLQQVIILKKAVPFKGEIPHRKGKGMMSGRYPVDASKLFIPMLKTLKGNASVNGLDLIKTRITSASTHLAPRPQRRGGEKGKRAHVILEAREVNLNKEKK